MLLIEMLIDALFMYFEYICININVLFKELCHGEKSQRRQDFGNGV